MHTKFIYFLLLLAAVLNFSCKERYFPNIVSTGTGYLVVEGILNAGNEPTNIRLTRTYPVDGSSGSTFVDNAVVTVEGNDNSIVTLASIGNGNYEYANLNLSPNNEYRLHIKISDGKEYLSDFVKVKLTPEIDSINYKSSTDGLQIFVNTHDPSNNTKYYRWSYDETWEINSFFNSSLIYDKEVDNHVRFRSPSEMVYRCWKYGKSTSILFASSAKLKQDIIHEYPIKTIYDGEDRLSVRYSILVKQYVMDKAAYEFYDLMKKNTESLGTIFDPMPSEIRGNIKCVSNPDDIVIGYISACNVVQKRIFINRPSSWKFFQLCEPKIVTPDSVDIFLGNGNYIPVSLQPRDNSPIIDYLSSTANCVDCRVRGGNVQKPSYWE